MPEAFYKKIIDIGVNGFNSVLNALTTIGSSLKEEVEKVITVIKGHGQATVTQTKQSGEAIVSAIKNKKTEINVAPPQVNVSPPVVNVNIPDVIVPEIKVPDVVIPEIKLPDIKIPEIKVPSVNIPDVIVPEIKIPKIKIPKIETPIVNVEAPKIKVEPKITVKTPDKAISFIGGDLGTKKVDVSSKNPLPVILTDEKGKFYKAIMTAISAGGGGGGSFEELKSVAIPVVSNTLLVAANIQYSVVLSKGTKKFKIYAVNSTRTRPHSAVLRYSYSSLGNGSWAAKTCVPIPAGNFEKEEGLELKEATTLYFSSPTGGNAVVIVITWQ